MLDTTFVTTLRSTTIPLTYACLWTMVQTQQAYNGRLQIFKHKYVEALRRDARISQVCSHVLRSASRQHVQGNFFSSHVERHIHVEESFFFEERSSSSPIARAVSIWFVVQFSLLCQLRCKVGATDLICTWWQRLSDVTYRHLGRSADCHRQHYRRT